MILPIHTYGAPVLREKTVPVEDNSPELQKLIHDLLMTMHGADGIGLAAPQVGRTERVFVADLSPLEEDLIANGELAPLHPLVFINPVIESFSETLGEFEEGCLSIPDIREVVVRPLEIRVRFLDRNFEEQTMDAGGMLARVIQHELDHLDGILFLDHVSPFRRRLLRRRLRDMAAGFVEAEYPIAVPGGGNVPV